VGWCVGIEQTRIQLLTSLQNQIHDIRVMEAVSRVKRELFVPSELYEFAYDDRPLGIGYDQTISQPLIVAIMTEALNLEKTDKVLELGTGSGYQTAILAELAGFVISIERIPELLATAQKVLNSLQYRNIELHLAGEELGWRKDSPYNAILVTAAAPQVPDELVEQLETGGRLVIPVGTRWEQDLLKITKEENGTTIENLGGCRFVSLIGPGAWDSDK